jgi:hypothetical protein
LKVLRDRDLHVQKIIGDTEKAVTYYSYLKRCRIQALNARLRECAFILRALEALEA